MAPDASFEARTYHKVDVRLLPFLFLCYILAYLDRVNVGFAKLQMLKDLSMSDAAFATGAGIFFIGYFFFEVPSNVLLKKFGARLWIARIMITWGVISSAMMYVTSEWAFYVMRFILGLADEKDRNMLRGAAKQDISAQGAEIQTLMPGEALIVNLAAPFAVPAHVYLYSDLVVVTPAPPSARPAVAANVSALVD